MGGIRVKRTGPHGLARKAKVCIFRGDLGGLFQSYFQGQDADAVVGLLCREVCVDRSLRHRVLECREQVPAVVVATAEAMVRTKNMAQVSA